MEKRIYTDNFERFVKETADDFKMIPSRRVWHSIYNDLHPSRKWPSLLMCLLLLTGMLFIGYENNTSTNETFNEINNTNNKQLAGTTNIKNNQQNLLEPKSNTATNKENNNPQSSLLISTMVTDNKSIILSKTNTNIGSLTNFSTQNKKATKKLIVNELNTSGNNAQKSRKKFASNSLVTKSTNKQTRTNEEEDEFAVSIPSNNIKLEDVSNSSNTENNLVNTALLVSKTDTKLDKKDKIATKKEPIKRNEDLATQNNAKKKSWMQNATMEFYATPSIGYRNLSTGPQYDANPTNLNSPSTVSTTNLDELNPMKHKAALNIETGFNIAYATSKRIKLKAGVQLNLTNYGIEGNITNHPSPTTLATYNNTTQAINYVAVSSSINNGNYALDKIHNTTYQISLPIGAYYKLLNKQQFDVFVGGSLQPTYIFGGKPNIISSDRKYYINEANLLRKWNMNTAAEAYINYKVGDLNFLAGPQFRYQLFSTYNKNIVATEKLYNIGFKVGISKKF